MAVCKTLCAGIFLASALVHLGAAAQASAAPAAEASSLSRKEGRIMLDYQQVKVAGDEPIDFMGLHVLKPVTDSVWIGAGVYAPLFKGEYGGFTAFDVGVHLRHRLTQQVFAAAGLAAGGGGGGRGIEQSKSLSGTGGFYKGYLGLGYEFPDFSLGLNVSKMKFKRSAIDGTQANVFMEIPYSYLTGPFSRHGEALSAADSRLVADKGGESTLTLVLDNYRQLRPQGSYKGRLQVADLQYANYFAADSYWYFGLGVGLGGLPLYNHVIGGLGQRLALSPNLTLHGQLGVGSGGYAPELIDTRSGLLVYPRLSAEYALTKNLGLSLSAGYLVGPKGSWKNQTFGVALTHHIRSGNTNRSTSPDAVFATAASQNGATFQAFRFGVFQQTEFNIRYRNLVGETLQSVGLQGDAILNDRWYIPLQAAVGYSAYFGYPGYGEVLTGLGVQTLAGPADRMQFFGQLMAGANVHGPAVKASGGLRYALNEQLALQAEAGRTAARSSSGGRFSADSLSLGLVYRFSVVQR